MVQIRAEAGRPAYYGMYQEGKGMIPLKMHRDRGWLINFGGDGRGREAGREGQWKRTAHARGLRRLTTSAATASLAVPARSAARTYYQRRSAGRRSQEASDVWPSYQPFILLLSSWSKIHQKLFLTSLNILSPW
jgi:hypothetical protein